MNCNPSLLELIPISASYDLICLPYFQAVKYSYILLGTKLTLQKTESFTRAS